MGEDETLNGLELDDIEDEIDAADFQQAWEAYARSDCSICGRSPGSREDGRGGYLETICASGKMDAAEDYESGLGVHCPGFIRPC